MFFSRKIVAPFQGVPRWPRTPRPNLPCLLHLPPIARLLNSRRAEGPPTPAAAARRTRVSSPTRCERRLVPAPGTVEVVSPRRRGRDGRGRRGQPHGDHTGASRGWGGGDIVRRRARRGGRVRVCFCGGSRRKVSEKRKYG